MELLSIVSVGAYVSKQRALNSAQTTFAWRSRLGRWRAEGMRARLEHSHGVVAVQHVSMGDTPHATSVTSSDVGSASTPSNLNLDILLRSSGRISTWMTSPGREHG